MKNKDIAIGQHCWATADVGDEKRLLVVLKTSSDSYAVCGSWELEISSDEIEIIEIIGRPKGMESTPLYYLPDDV